MGVLHNLKNRSSIRMLKMLQRIMRTQAQHLCKENMKNPWQNTKCQVRVQCSVRKGWSRKKTSFKTEKGKQRLANVLVAIINLFFPGLMALYKTCTFIYPWHLCGVWSSGSLNTVIACHPVLGKTNNWYLGRHRLCFFGKAIVAIR